MGRTRVGGVVVARGGTVKWGLLFSILAGSGIYAYFEGSISLMYGFGEFVGELAKGVRSWLVTLIDLEFAVGTAAAQTAWWEFWEWARPAGLFAWFLTVIAVASVIVVFFVLVKRGVSAIV